MREFAALRLKEPKGAPGSCWYGGVGVKGNLSWGDVLLEVLDSNGKGRLLQSDGDGPVKLRGPGVTLPRPALHATERAPGADRRVRLKDACFF